MPLNGTHLFLPARRHAAEGERESGERREQESFTTYERVVPREGRFHQCHA